MGHKETQAEAEERRNQDAAEWIRREGGSVYPKPRDDDSEEDEK